MCIISPSLLRFCLAGIYCGAGHPEAVVELADWNDGMLPERDAKTKTWSKGMVMHHRFRATELGEDRKRQIEFACYVYGAG
jgi:hypothetical protein